MFTTMNQTKKTYLSGKIPNDVDLELLRIGPEFQAEIPQLKSWNFCDFIQSDEDKNLWRPSIMPEDEVVDYLNSVRREGWKGLNEEKALMLLHRCNYDKKEALRRFSLLQCGYASSPIWSQIECELFEEGIGKFGKDFISIQKMVRSKSINEIVEFYYSWKKSERYDVFMVKLGRGKSKFKTGQKKKMYRITDFAELFEQQLAKLDNKVQTRSRSRFLCAN